MIKTRKDTQAETWGGNEYSIGRNAQVKAKAMAERQNSGKGSGKGREQRHVRMSFLFRRMHGDSG